MSAKKTANPLTKSSEKKDKRVKTLTEQEVRELILRGEDDIDEAYKSSEDEKDVKKSKNENSRNQTNGCSDSDSDEGISPLPVYPPRKENCRVSPLKLKRKSEYAINKISSPARTKNSKNVVSPIVLIRRMEIEIVNSVSKPLTPSTKNNIIEGSTKKDEENWTRTPSKTSKHTTLTNGHAETENYATPKRSVRILSSQSARSRTPDLSVRRSQRKSKPVYSLSDIDSDEDNLSRRQKMSRSSRKVERDKRKIEEEDGDYAPLDLSSDEIKEIKKKIESTAISKPLSELTSNEIKRRNEEKPNAVLELLRSSRQAKRDREAIKSLEPTPKSKSRNFNESAHEVNSSPNVESTKKLRTPRTKVTLKYASDSEEEADLATPLCEVPCAVQLTRLELRNGDGNAVSKLITTKEENNFNKKNGYTPVKETSKKAQVSSPEDEIFLPRNNIRKKKEENETPSRSLRKRSQIQSAIHNGDELSSPVRRLRSNSVTASPRTPSLRQRVLEANTPRNQIIELIELLETPLSTGRSPSAKKKLNLTPTTPHSLKKVGHGFLTPIIASRETKTIRTPSSGLDLARSQLQASTVPTSLPCREKEFANIKSFLVRKIEDRTGGCMYISGVPGTGKTATVHTVVKSLQQYAQDGELDPFDFVEINGLRLTEPRQAYVRIWQTLTNNKLPPEQSLKSLETRFNGKTKRSTVLLIDELDYLCNKRQDVIYNILDWSTKRNSKLVVLTIANTMDLPERTLKGKVTSRMGLTRLVFQPYTYQQLQEIVMNRLSGCKSFHPDAVQLVARKVAAVSGDARRALDICRRSTELLDSDSEIVTVSHIQKALTVIFTGVRVQAIRNCSITGQMILRSLRDEVLRTGVEETTVSLMMSQLIGVCAMEGCPVPNVGEILSICSSLADSGLIIAEKGRKDLNKKLSLNVSPDDIHYALNCKN